MGSPIYIVWMSYLSWPYNTVSIQVLHVDISFLQNQYRPSRSIRFCMATPLDLFLAGWEGRQGRGVTMSGLELHEACTVGDRDALESYLRSGKYDVNLKDPEWKYKTALHWAAHKGIYTCIYRHMYRSGSKFQVKFSGRLILWTCQ